MEQHPVIETHQLTKIYHRRLIAVNGVTVEVPDGKVVGLLGSNGAGKTTLIRLLLGLHRPSAGRVRVFDQPVGPNAARLRRRIGYLPTSPQFPPYMTAITYLDYVGKLFGMLSQERRPRLARLLRAVDLLAASGQALREFSTGMTTRLGIAASLINDPELLIWDEPTHGLDPEGRRDTLDLVKELAGNRTLLISSHILADVDEVCDHVVVLSKGALVFNGSMSDLKRRIRPRAVRLDVELSDESWGELEPRWRGDERFATLQRGPRHLELAFGDGVVLAEVLSGVLSDLAGRDATVQSVRTLGHTTEEAFLDILDEEEQRGFRRVHE